MRGNRVITHEDVDQTLAAAACDRTGCSSSERRAMVALSDCSTVVSTRLSHGYRLNLFKIATGWAAPLGP